MKDLFQNYHRHKILSNLGILSLSAILAMSINSFVLSGETGDMLKANVLESSINTPVTLDFSASYNENQVKFENSQDMKNVTELSFSLAYDSDTLNIGDIVSHLEEVNITKIENQSGFITYILNFSNPQNIMANSTLATISSEKNGESTTHINIINVNFTDSSGEVFMLSTTGIML